LGKSPRAIAFRQRNDWFKALGFADQVRGIGDYCFDLKAATASKLALNSGTAISFA
jgi:hypothetical protein